MTVLWLWALLAALLRLGLGLHAEVVGVLSNYLRGTEQ